jgi:1,4-dihydroxy-6-naphthoate synthase
MTQTPLDLAYSPCPNDTFIFAAWTQALLADSPPVRVVLDDVEALNLAARAAEHALTKVSYGAIPYLLKDYRILRAGGALGRGCGPLVIARPGTAGASPELAALPRGARIAIPGELTTAYLLLRLALVTPFEPVVMRFDRIVDAVAGASVDAGLIIHESRFTYQDAGLVRVADLGEWWEGETGCAIPLGAILARRDLEPPTASAIDETIRRSLQFAYDHGEAVAPYVREHAFEMSDDVMRAHIALYVNEFSFDLGEEGEAAITRLFEFASSAGLLPPGVHPEFV